MSMNESIALESPAPTWCGQLVDGLTEQGWVVLEQSLPDSLVTALRADIEAGASLNPARIGRAGQHQANAEIRRDKTRWLEPASPAAAEYLQLMEQVRGYLNRELFLGLQEFEAHYARYDAGDFYRRHVDALKGQRNRVVTSVSYLNPDWQADWGGELVLYDEQDVELTRVLPRAGTSLFFLSESFPHEVLPASTPRYSIAGWFRLSSQDFFR